MVIALLAGGTGGAKLAVGLRDALRESDGGELHVIANTGDDIEIYDAHVSPDPDLITYRLAGMLDERGFGVRGETHDEMRQRREAGEEVWFELGDEDLAVCRARAAALSGGSALTEAHRAATARYETGCATVLPMSDQSVRTMIDTPGGTRSLQRFLISDRCEPAILGVRFEGIEYARPSDRVLRAIEASALIVIGPSNPVISIGPILSLPGMRDALATAAAPVAAVSPFVGGQVLKGPTAAFMAAAGVAPGVAGVVDFYRDFYGDPVDTWVADEPLGDRSVMADVRMDDDAQALRLARVLLSRIASDGVGPSVLKEAR